MPIISTQLVTDTLLGERESLENLVGATFVFGMRSEAEARRALRAARPRPGGPPRAPDPARARRRPLSVPRPPRTGGGDPGRRGRAVAAARVLDDAPDVTGESRSRRRSSRSPPRSRRRPSLHRRRPRHRHAPRTRPVRPADRRSSQPSAGAPSGGSGGHGRRCGGLGARQRRRPARGKRARQPALRGGWRTAAREPAQLRDLRLRGGRRADRRLRAGRAHRRRTARCHQPDAAAGRSGRAGVDGARVGRAHRGRGAGVVFYA